MFVGHGTQIMLLLCMKHWRITSIVKLGVLSGNGIMCRGHKKTRKLKTRHLCDLLHNFTTISLIRKPKKYLKRIANFYKVANCQPVITPTSIWLLKVNFKRTRTRCEICSELKIEIANLCHSGVFIVNFQHISYFLPVFFLLNLNMLIPTRNILKLLNVRLILRHCLCFLMGLMAQNLKTNHILHSGKVSLCNLNHCKSLLMKKNFMVSYSFAYHYTNTLHFERTY